MIKFLTSNLNHYHKENGNKIANEVDNTNGLVDQIKQYLKATSSILFISADSKDTEKVIQYSNLLFVALKLSVISFNEYNILYEDTKNKAKELVNKADFIFLSGGDTYIQNCFFNEINLKELLKNFDGIVIGQSAGSINMATNVFNSPEEKEESEPIYFEGLGLTELNIEPHFNLDSTNFNEYENYQRDYILKESEKRTIYALCDTSHILIINDEKNIYGESYIIKNGIINKICDIGNKYIIK